MSDSVRPHRKQPTGLPRPWDSPGENTGVGCHFLLQCMKVKSQSEVPQSYPTVSDPMDCSPPGPSIHRHLQARVLEWVPSCSPILHLEHISIQSSHILGAQLPHVANGCHYWTVKIQTNLSCEHRCEDYKQ